MKIAFVYCFATLFLFAAILYMSEKTFTLLLSSQLIKMIVEDHHVRILGLFINEIILLVLFSIIGIIFSAFIYPFDQSSSTVNALIINFIVNLILCLILMYQNLSYDYQDYYPKYLAVITFVAVCIEQFLLTSCGMIVFKYISFLL